MPYPNWVPLWVRKLHQQCGGSDVGDDWRIVVIEVSRDNSYREAYSNEGTMYFPDRKMINGCLVIDDGIPVVLPACPGNGSNTMITLKVNRNKVYIAPPISPSGTVHLYTHYMAKSISASNRMAEVDCLTHDNVLGTIYLEKGDSHWRYEGIAVSELPRKENVLVTDSSDSVGSSMQSIYDLSLTIPAIVSCKSTYCEIIELNRELGVLQSPYRIPDIKQKGLEETPTFTFRQPVFSDNGELLVGYEDSNNIPAFPLDVPLGWKLGAIRVCRTNTSKKNIRASETTVPRDLNQQGIQAVLSGLLFFLILKSDCQRF